MFEITDETVLDYLAQTGRLTSPSGARAETLAWGVSNVVVRVRPVSGDDFIVKQSRAQLRTQADWFSRLDRIYRETEFLQALAPLLPSGRVPRVLFEDRANYLFAMEAVDADHTVWKAALLDGQTDSEIAAALGELLATIHGRTAQDARLCQQFGDREVFVQLRVDPFYRRVADVHPGIRPHIEQLIDEMFRTRVCLVHADFSPKNILVTGSGLTLVDFETGHYGDPAFDLGFFLSHLLLKTIARASRFSDYATLVTAFWDRYRAGVGRAGDGTVFGELSLADLQRRAIAHLAACLLARIDGKSTIDYLPESSSQNFVRAFGIGLLEGPPSEVHHVLMRLGDELSQHS